MKHTIGAIWSVNNSDSVGSKFALSGRQVNSSFSGSENEVRADLIAGKLGEPDSGLNYFIAKGSCGSGGGGGSCCGGHKCNCELSMVMNRGCQCGGC